MGLDDFFTERRKKKQEPEEEDELEVSSLDVWPEKKDIKDMRRHPSRIPIGMFESKKRKRGI